MRHPALTCITSSTESKVRVRDVLFVSGWSEVQTRQVKPQWGRLSHIWSDCLWGQQPVSLGLWCSQQRRSTDRTSYVSLVFLQACAFFLRICRWSYLLIAYLSAKSLESLYPQSKEANTNFSEHPGLNSSVSAIWCKFSCRRFLIHWLRCL